MWRKESSINWSQGYPLQAGEYGKKRGRDGGGEGDRNKRVGEEEMKKRSDVIREGESLGEERDKLRRKRCHKDM